ncbi:MAG: hypothetical protein JNL01_08935 [Bdellovibrionales bacterium]|nr:hypothetical protein [Bdellovibrionales bacterium]
MPIRFITLAGAVYSLSTFAWAQDPASTPEASPTPSPIASPSASPSPTSEPSPAVPEGLSTDSSEVVPKPSRVFIEFFDPTGKPVPNDWPYDGKVSGTGKNRKVNLYFWMPKQFEWFPAPDSPLVPEKVPRGVKSLDPARRLNQGASVVGVSGDPIGLFREKGKSEVSFMMRVKVEDAELGSSSKPGLNLGAAFDFANYSEQPFDISTTQFGLALVGDYMMPVHPKWRLIGSFRFTALPFSSSASNLPLARYYGVGVQGSYALEKLKWMNLDWRIGLGPLLWGMLVPNSAYGVSSVFGPQLVFGGASKEINSNYKAMGIRFAYLGNGIDVRARYETSLFAAEGNRPWFIFYELSYASFSNPTQGNSLTLIHGAVGFRVSMSKLEKQNIDEPKTDAVDSARKD